MRRWLELEAPHLTPCLPKSIPITGPLTLEFIDLDKTADCLRGEAMGRAARREDREKADNMVADLMDEVYRTTDGFLWRRWKRGNQDAPGCSYQPSLPHSLATTDDGSTIAVAECRQLCPPLRLRPWPRSETPSAPIFSTVRLVFTRKQS